MSTSLYKSILISQPADNTVVFIRRFTRDPPVLALWNETAQTFTLISSLSITIVGGTQAGDWTLAASSSVHGHTGWLLNSAGVDIFVVNLGGGSYEFDTEETATSSGWFQSMAGPPTAGMVLTAPFTPFNSPTITSPTTVTIHNTPTAALIIPAYLVAAWRPQ